MPPAITWYSSDSHTNVSSNTTVLIFPGVDDPNTGTTGHDLVLACVRKHPPAHGYNVAIAPSPFTPWRTAHAMVAQAGLPAPTHVIAFSGGAITVIHALDEPTGWTRVTLADPSIPADTRALLAKHLPVPGLDHRVHMTYNPENWRTTFPAMYPSIAPFVDALTAAGGTATLVKQYHLRFLIDALEDLGRHAPAPVGHEGVIITIGLTDMVATMVAAMFGFIVRRRNMRAGGVAESTPKNPDPDQ